MAKFNTDLARLIRTGPACGQSIIAFGIVCCAVAILLVLGVAAATAS